MERAITLLFPRGTLVDVDVSNNCGQMWSSRTLSEDTEITVNPDWEFQDDKGRNCRIILKIVPWEFQDDRGRNCRIILKIVPGT